MILVDSLESIPSIVQIPRQIQKQELLKLMSLEWLSNYEKFHQNTQPVQTTNAHFEKRADGTVKLTFQSPSTSQTPIVSYPPSEQSTPRNSFSYCSMITAVSAAQENLPIHRFSSDGYPIYPDKINGHFLWDVPGSHMCDPDCPCPKTRTGMMISISALDTEKRRATNWIHVTINPLYLQMIQIV